MDEELKKELESLGEGEELVKEDGEDIVTYIKPALPKQCEEHQFMPVANGEQCVICGNGRIG